MRCDPFTHTTLVLWTWWCNLHKYLACDQVLYFHLQDVEIKKMGGNATYGFILYYDLMSAVTAKQYMDGHDLKGNKLRVSGQEERWGDWGGEGIGVCHW